MKDKRFVSSFFGMLSALLMTGTVCLSLFGSSLVPQVRDDRNSAADAVRNMLLAVQAGDVSRVSECFIPGTDFEKLLCLNDETLSYFYGKTWQAMTFSLDGEPYSAENTVALDVQMTCVSTSEMAAVIREGVNALWEQRSREATLQDVVNMAVDAAMNTAVTRTEKVPVHLVPVDGSWKIIPENNLVNALSGWVQR